MKTMTIGKKITLGFAAILGMVCLLTLSAYILLGNAKHAAHLLSVDAMPGTDLMAKINSDLGQAQLVFLDYVLAKTPEERAKIKTELSKLGETISKELDDYDKTITTTEDRELFTKLKEARVAYVAVRTSAFDLLEAGKTEEARQLIGTSIQPAYYKYEGFVRKELDLNTDQADKELKACIAATDSALLFILSIAFAVLVAGIVIATVMTTGLNKMLRQLAASLSDGSNQVAGAAGQVSSSSQSLAEGASEQAASLEETSSSLEELSSMTRRNSENAQKANELAKQSRTAADKGVGDMQSMNAAMEAIKNSSDDIAKIIKTIDEIAFQTNILALNAAVEAARAGEAGMGFAVVADEVRNLAQRSAQAAKETAAKIEGAISKTGQGVEISRKVGETLNEIVTKARQVDELAAEVASASREQTQGITQINLAVGQMDKVTQSNAANAEESAAAAEELNAQAAVMQQSVGELMALVGGSSHQSQASHTPVAAPAKPPRARDFHPAPAAKKASHSTSSNGSNGHHPSPSLSSPAKGRSEIPMEGDFKDF